MKGSSGLPTASSNGRGSSRRLLAPGVTILLLLSSFSVLASDPVKGAAPTASTLTSPVRPGSFSAAGASAGVEGLSWIEVPTATSPGPLAGASIAYDPIDGYVVLFGGSTGSGLVGLTWTYHNGAWTELHLPNAPSPRDYAAMTWDASMGYVLLFGGWGNGGSPLSDTWAFVHGEWSRLTFGQGQSPYGRYLASMTYDQSTGQVILFGGLNGSTVFPVASGGFWTFSRGAWTETFTNGPPSRYAASLSWDTNSSGEILFGGASPSGIALGDTWQLQFGTWAQLQPEPAPGALQGASLASDPALGLDVLFGGWNGSTGLQNTTWEESDGAWTNLSPVLGVSPPSSYQSSMVFDTSDGYLILYGGWSNDGILNQTWELVARPNPVSFQATPNPVSWDRPTALEVNATWISDQTSFAYSGLPPGCATLNSSQLQCTPTRPGNYTVMANISQPGDSVVNVNLTLNVLTNETIHLVQVSPNSWFFQPGQTQSFIANASGNRGTNLTDNSTFGWSVSPDTLGTLLSTSGPEVSFEAGGLGGNGTITVTIQYNGETVSRSVSVEVNATIPPPGLLEIRSEFGGDFLTNVTVVNTFGIYTTENAAFGSVRWSIGNESYDGAPPASDSSPWTLSLNVGTLRPGTTIWANATYAANNSRLEGQFTVPLFWTPNWLQGLFDGSGGSSVDLPVDGEGWNQSYTVSAVVTVDLANLVGETTNVPLLGDLAAEFLPSPNLDVLFDSRAGSGNSSLEITGSFALSPSFKIDGVNVTVDANVTAAGSFSFSDHGFIQWNSAWMNVSIRGSVSVTLPIMGEDFDLAGHQIDLGLSFRLTVDPAIALTFLLEPTSDQSLELVRGLGLAIENVTGELSVTLTPEVTFGLGVFSVSAGAHLQFTEYLKSPPFAIVGTEVQGTIFASFSFLWWSWSWSEGVYNRTWGTIPSGYDMAPSGYGADTASPGPIQLNLTVLPRYYATPGYDSVMWRAGEDVGTAVHDLFPMTQVAGASSGSNALLWYTTDDLSLPRTTGIQLAGFGINTSTRSLISVAPPVEEGLISFDPRVASLPDGEDIGVWEAIPDTAVSGNGSNAPLQLQLQAALYSSVNNSWGTIQNLSAVHGFVQGLGAMSCGGAPEIVALVSSALLPTGPEDLETVDYATGQIVDNVTVEGYSNVEGTACSPAQAILGTGVSSFEIVNLTSGRTSEPVPGLRNASMIDLEYVAGTADTLAEVYSEMGADIVVIYDPQSGQTFGPFAAGSNETTEIRAQWANSTYYVALQSATGLQIWTIGSPTSRTIDEDLSEPGVQDLGLVATSTGLVLWDLVNYNNQSRPLLNLSLSVIPISAVPSPSPPTVPPPVVPPAGSTGTNATLMAPIALISVGGALLVMAIGVPYLSYRREKPRAPASVRSSNGTVPRADAGPRPESSRAVPRGDNSPGGAIPLGPGTRTLGEAGAGGRQVEFEP
jgi:hypothetical protein